MSVIEWVYNKNLFPLVGVSNMRVEVFARDRRFRGDVRGKFFTVIGI